MGLFTLYGPQWLGPRMGPSLLYGGLALALGVPHAVHKGSAHLLVQGTLWLSLVRGK